MVRSGLRNELVEGWSPTKKIEKWTKSRGYGELFLLNDENLKRLAERHSGVTSGLYLIEATNHEIYIGVSTTHIRTRFHDHTRKWPDIQGFRFIPSTESMPQLRVREASLVHEAERKDFVHRNHEYASVIQGKKKLDELIAPDLQDAWLKSPFETNLRHLSDQLPVLEPSQVAGNRYKYERLTQDNSGDQCLAVLAAYLRNCVPLPIRTEATFWTTTCYPDWNKSSRVLTCTMHWLEVLFIHRDVTSGRLSAALAIDKRELPRLGFRSILRAKYGASYVPNFHARSGGTYIAGLDFNDLAQLIAALDQDTFVRRAAARYAIGRMSLGQSGYKPSHNRNLAAPALESAFPEKQAWQ